LFVWNATPRNWGTAAVPIPVSLKEVTDTIDACGSHMNAFFDRKTGEIVQLPNSNWTSDVEEFEADIERVENSEDFVELPNLADLREYRIMENFALSREDDRTRERLEDAISGKGAFRRFKDMVARLGIRDEWFAYRFKELALEVAGHLDLNKIAFTDDVGLPERPRFNHSDDDDEDTD
jgi:Uncharacterised protein family (UPF0158)